jgi:ABC-2 type transport system permease protein
MLRQVRYTNTAFWRNPAAAFFTFVFPLMFLVIFTVLFGSGTSRISATQEIETSTFYIPAIAVFSVITACYTNIAMSLTFARDGGILKRTRGTPLPGWAYLSARVIHSVLVAVLLVVIVVVFGVVFYDAEPPTESLPAFLVTLVVGAAAFCALGTAITIVVPNADAAPAVINASILPLLFISKVFIPFDEDDVPVWIDVLSKLFPVRHFADAMLGSYFPLLGESAWKPESLVVMAAWGVAGLVVAARWFSWEPRR